MSSLDETRSFQRSLVALINRVNLCRGVYVCMRSYIPVFHAFQQVIADVLPT